MPVSFRAFRVYRGKLSLNTIDDLVISPEAIFNQY